MRPRRPAGGWCLAVFALCLAIAGGCAAAAAGTRQAIDWTTATPVTVAAVEYRFEPDHLVFERGRAYRLRVVNRGHELHELTAPKFYRAVELRDTRALNREDTEIVVEPGEHQELYFVARRRGHFKFWCADHDWAGMTGEITVN